MQPLIVCSSCGRARIRYGIVNNQQLCEDCYDKLNNENELVNNADFIALDFEIANNMLSSACSLGMVFVKDQQIIDEKYFLIQPPTLEFDKKTIEIHGITADDVRHEKKFNEIWHEISPFFNKDTKIIAHNAQFDMSVLHCCLTEYSLDFPEFTYADSISISTKQCRGERIGNSLKERLSYFNIQLENHHNALSDAKACAELVIKCLELKKKKTLESYLNTYSSISQRSFSELKPQTEFKKRGERFGHKVTISEIAVTVESIKVNNPFFGKNVVFTGDLQSMNRREAMQEVVNFGGIVRSTVNGSTNYIIVGVQDKSLVGNTGMSTKERKAFELIQSGKDIKIINESEFLRMLES